METACIYQETRLNLDPAAPGSTVDLLLPSSNASAFAARLSPKRRRVDRPNTTYTEEYFTERFLAEESSIYIRKKEEGSKKQVYPRNILWRLVDGRKTLELQAVDIYQDSSEKSEALLTLRFTLPDPVRPQCVAFAENEARTVDKAFFLFVVTTAGELFTIKLSKDAFIKPGFLDNTEVVNNEWCQSSTPGAFRVGVYRIYAKNDAEIWASLIDGALVKLDRVSSDNASSWSQTWYGERSWKSSVRGLISWSKYPSVRYGNEDLSDNAASALALSPDGTLLWTVCLNHTIKIWNIETGRTVYYGDLLGDISRDLQKPTEQIIDPSNTRLIEFLPRKRRDRDTIITYSPIYQQFKVWYLVVDDAEYRLEDAFPEVNLVPPIDELVEATTWSLGSFYVQPPQTAKGKEWRMWLLVKFGTGHSIYTTTIELEGDSDTLQKGWRSTWSRVYEGFNTAEALKLNLQQKGGINIAPTKTESEGVVERYLSFLFYPGRFSVATLETALHIYRGGLLERQVRTPDNGTAAISLADRITNEVARTVQLQHTDANEPDYSQFAHDTALEWHRFYGVVQDLHKRREYRPSLAFDSVDSLAWLVTADQAAPVRVSSETEILYLNCEEFEDPERMRPDSLLLSALEDSNNASLGQLISAISSFRSSLSPSFQIKFASTVRSIIMEEIMITEEEEIQQIYDRSQFEGQISDDDYNRLTIGLEPLGGFGYLNNDVFTNILNLLQEQQRGSHMKRRLTHYGTRSLARVSQELIKLHSEIINDLFLLHIFMAQELETGDLSEEYDSGTAQQILRTAAKQNEVLNWLVGTPNPSDVMKLKTLPTSGENDTTPDSQLPDEPISYVPSLLESIFLGDFASLQSPSGPLSELLTYWPRAWTDGIPIIEHYEGVTAHIMGYLIKNNITKLAFEFLRFLPNTAWTRYLRGRLHLSSGEFQTAAISFSSSLSGLGIGKGFDLQLFDSMKLLDLEERQLFNNGAARYYQHIMTLFDERKIMSHVAEFASLALSAMEAEGGEEPVKTHLRSRLFTAALQTSQYDTAFSTLLQYTDLALRKHSLQKFLATVLAQGRLKLLLSMAESLPNEVASDIDTYLASLILSPGQTKGAATETVASKLKVQPHKILYAYRLKRQDLRGAASCLWERLQILRYKQQQSDRMLLYTGDESDTADLDDDVVETFMALINIFSLMDPSQAWVLTRPLPSPPSGRRRARKLAADASGHVELGKRRIVTLEDVRKLWQQELDRRADSAAGRFPLLGPYGMGDEGSDDEMSVDVQGVSDVFAS